LKLPNGNQAIGSISKLRDYCLSTTHPRGRHKARVCESALGFTAEDAAYLLAVLLEAASTHDVVLGERDGYGQRYSMDVLVKGTQGKAIVRSSWIILHHEDTPRLTSCYVV
jgi:hypothetical protein